MSNDTNSIPFETTPEQASTIASIADKMKDAGLDVSFIMRVSELAYRDQGIYDLMVLWINSPRDPDEQYNIIKDLYDLYAAYWQNVGDLK